MYDLKVKNNNGEILKLSGNPNYIIEKIEGLNPPQATINTSVNTTMDGSTINSARLENRNIVIYLAIKGDVEFNRINLYKYFPSKKIVTIYFTNGLRKVYIEGMVESLECDLFSNPQMAQISLICEEPYFKDVNNLITNFSDVTSLFEFPFSIDKNGVEISIITHNIRKIIYNVGNVETGISIKLFAIGTVVNPIIYDVLKKTHMGLNFTMQPSDTIIIDTNTRRKTIELIRSGVTTNILGNMTMDSSFFVLNSGDNIFSYDCESGGDNLQLTFTNSILYSGV